MTAPDSRGEGWRDVIGTRGPVGYALLHFAEIADTDGVPLTSDRSLLPAATDGSIDWQYGGCPYVTSPSRLPENQDADPPKPMSFLEQRRLQENYLTILGMVRHLRPAIAGETGDEPLSYIDASRVLAATRFAAHYFLFRAERPLDPDAVPPSLLVAHNSALGALTGLGNGGVGGYRSGEPVPEDAPSPSIDEMMEATERKGAFVGRKTVCAAPPAMTRHLLAAVLTDAKLERGRTPKWFAAQLPDDEIVGLSRFADAMQLFEVAATVLETYDADTAKSVRAEMETQGRRKPGKRNPRRIRGLINDFRNTTAPYIGRMMSAHDRINSSLGRTQQASAPEAFIGPTGETHMPALLDELLAENPEYLPPKLLTGIMRDRA